MLLFQRRTFQSTCIAGQFPNKEQFVLIRNITSHYLAPKTLQFPEHRFYLPDLHLNCDIASLTQLVLFFSPSDLALFLAEDRENIYSVSHKGFQDSRSFHYVFRVGARGREAVISDYEIALLPPGRSRKESSN